MRRSLCAFLLVVAALPVAAEASSQQWLWLERGRLEATLYDWQTGQELLESLDTDRDGRVSSPEAHALNMTMGPATIPSSCQADYDWTFMDGRGPAVIQLNRTGLNVEGRVEARRAGSAIHVHVAFDESNEHPKVRIRLAELDDLDHLASCTFGESIDLFGRLGKPDVVQLMGGDDAWIQSDSLSPAWLRQRLNPYGELVYDPANQTFTDGRNSNELYLRGEQLGLAYQQEIRFSLGPRPPDWPWETVAAATTVAAALGLASTEIGRFRLRQWSLGILLFTRLTKAKALENPTRDRLVDHVTQNPGVRFRELRRELGVGQGTLTHHLRVLEQQRVLVARRDGVRCRIYPAGTPLPPWPLNHPVQDQILELVTAKPGLRQRDLAHTLRIPRKNVSYHADVLESRGQVRSERRGTSRRYYSHHVP